MRQKVNSEIKGMMFFSFRNVKLGRTALISCLLFILYFCGAAAALEGSENVTAFVVGPELETTGIEHEDIGAAPTTTLFSEPTGIEEDDLGIAGSSKQETGKVETEFKVEKGEKSVPEIDDEVLVGFESGDTKSYKVEVRGWDPEDKEAAKTQYSESDLNFILTRAARTETELEEYTNALPQSDPNIKRIVISESVVALDYSFPAKILGLINIDYTYHAEVDATGRVKVKLPWYLFLTQNNAADVTSELEERLSTTGDDAQLANIDLQNTLQKQQLHLQTISTVMRVRHEAAKAAVNNVR